MVIIKTTFSDSSMDQDNVTFEEKNVQNFAKSMLLGRLFIGTFQEKRYIDSIHGYRDVISINPSEKELIYDLGVVKRRLAGVYKCWIGYTSSVVIGAPVGHCLWVELPEEILGRYWYKIKSIKFRNNEILLRLKVLRSVDEIDSPIANASDIDSSVHNLSVAEIRQKMVDLINYSKVNMVRLFKEIMTVKNIKDALVFLSLLLAAIVTGSIQLVQFLGDFSLKLFREISIFLNVTTPIILGVLNLIGRTIAGFYTLIILMWRDRKMVNRYEGNLVYDDSFTKNKALPYRPKNTLQITELN